MWGCTVAVAVLILGAVLAPPTAGMPPAVPLATDMTLGPSSTEATPVAWHWIANTTYGGQMYLDAQRERILSLIPGGQGYNLQVMNRSGAVQAILPNVMAPNYDYQTPQGRIDPVTGYFYLLDWHSGCPRPDTATLIVVDPGNATVRHTWSYPIGLAYFAVHGDRIYAAHRTDRVVQYPGNGYSCYQGPDGNLTVIDATNGSIETNLTDLPSGYVTTPPILDPSGRTLYVSVWNDTGSATSRVNLTDRTLLPFGTAGYLALSPDDRELHVCDPNTGTLRTYAVADERLASTGSCDGPIAVNPVTGAIASDWALTVTLGGVPVSLCPAISYVAWSRDGRALLGVNGAGPRPGIGSWDGTPAVNTTQTLVQPQREPLRLRLDSVGGVNDSSVSVAVDGSPFQDSTVWTYPWQAYLNLTSLPDGIHDLTVSGRDLVGQTFEDSRTFETDATPPGIEITSSDRTANTPYSLAGRIDEPHPSWIKVDGRNVPLTGTGWFTLVTLRIGDNRFLVEAADTLGNYANLTAHVRYWPDPRDNLTNSADHFSVSVPPGWAGEANVSLGGTTLSLLLVGPAEGSTAATFMVTTLPAKGAQETQDYVMAVADQQRNLLVGLGGSILVEPRYTTVDGRPAVTFEAWVYLGSDTTRYVETVVVSAAWERAYILTMGISELLWPLYEGAHEWIVEGFHIEPATQALPPPAQPWEPWLVIGLSGAVTATSIAVACLVWMRRRRPPRTAPLSRVQ